MQLFFKIAIKCNIYPARKTFARSIST